MKMKNNKFIENENLVELLLCGFAFILALIISGCGGSRADGVQSKIIQGRPVKTTVVTAANSNEIRSYPGAAKAVREINLAFRVGGPLIEYNLKTGEQIRKGDHFIEDFIFSSGVEFLQCLNLSGRFGGDATEPRHHYNYNNEPFSKRLSILWVLCQISNTL
jgi:hypothetical protein